MPRPLESRHDMAPAGRRREENDGVGASLSYLRHKAPELPDGRLRCLNQNNQNTSAIYSVVVDRTHNNALFILQLPRLSIRPLLLNPLPCFHRARAGSSRPERLLDLHEPVLVPPMVHRSSSWHLHVCATIARHVDIEGDFRRLLRGRVAAMTPFRSLNVKAFTERLRCFKLGLGITNLVETTCFVILFDKSSTSLANDENNRPSKQRLLFLPCQ